MQIPRTEEGNLLGFHGLRETFHLFQARTFEPVMDLWPQGVVLKKINAISTKKTLSFGVSLLPGGGQAQAGKLSAAD